VNQEVNVMLNPDVVEEDHGNPFSPQELLLALGSAMAWVTLSAVFALLLPVVLP